jgi:hypothetical protein
MLNARSIFLNNIDEFSQNFDTPYVLEFEERFIPASDDDMSVAFTEALGEVEEAAFVAGFNAAVRFLMGCISERNVQAAAPTEGKAND